VRAEQVALEQPRVRGQEGLEVVLAGAQRVVTDDPRPGGRQRLVVAAGLAVGRGEAPQPLARPRDGVLDAAASRLGEGDAQVIAMAEGLQRGGLEAAQEHLVGHVAPFAWRPSASSTR
jgi:hypothetical protein